MADKSYAGNPAHKKDPLADYRNQYDSLFQGTDYWDTYQGLLTQYSQFPEATFLGDLTGKNQTNRYNHLQNLGTALASLAENLRSTEYNSVESQVQREKAAGLNPDLTGVSGAGETSDSEMPQPIPATYDNPLPHIMSFMSMVGNAVIGAQSMLSQSVVNDSMRLQNLLTSKEIVLNDLGSVNPFEEGDIKPAFKLGYNTGSRNLDKKLERLSTRLYDSTEHHLSYRSRNKDINKIRKENFDIISSAGYSDDDEVYNKTAEFIADQTILLHQLELDSSTESAKTVKYRKKLWNDAIQQETRYIKWLKKRASKGNRTASRVLMWMSAEPGSGEGFLSGAISTGANLISKR